MLSELGQCQQEVRVFKELSYNEKLLAELFEIVGTLESRLDIYLLPKQPDLKNAGINEKPQSELLSKTTERIMQHGEQLGHLCTQVKVFLDRVE